MSLNQLYKQRQAKPVPSPTEPPPVKRSLVGPETVEGLVRHLRTGDGNGVYEVELWNDCMGRIVRGCNQQHVEQFSTAYLHNQPLAVTVEKLRGKWTVTKVEQVTT